MWDCMCVCVCMCILLMQIIVKSQIGYPNLRELPQILWHANLVLGAIFLVFKPTLLAQESSILCSLSTYFLIATEQLQELNLFKTTAGPLPTMSCVCLYENVCVCLYVRVFLCVSLCVCISQFPSVFWCQFCLYDWANRLQSICSRKELRATFDSHHGYPTLCGLPLMRS